MVFRCLSSFCCLKRYLANESLESAECSPSSLLPCAPHPVLIQPTRPPPYNGPWPVVASTGVRTFIFFFSTCTASAFVSIYRVFLTAPSFVHHWVFTILLLPSIPGKIICCSTSQTSRNRLTQSLFSKEHVPIVDNILITACHELFMCSWPQVRHWSTQ